MTDKESYQYMHSYKKQEQADRPHLRKAWSDDESTVTSSSGRRNTRSPRSRYHSSSIDETTILSSRSIRSKNNESTPNTFSDWMNYTNKLTSLVSKQIQDCTTAFEEDSDDEIFKLKDEDFYWNPNAQSFDTLETSRTKEVTKEAFSKWGQNINMWESHRNGFSEEMIKKTNHSTNRRRNVK